MSIFATKNNQHGFAMLEVMIAAFILGLGILSLAALQMKTYSLSRDSELRSIVSLQAENLADEMHANQVRSGGGVVNGVATNMTWSLDKYIEPSPFTSSSTLSAPNPSCVESSSAVSCNQQELAADDLYRFHQQLRANFPNAQDFVAQVCPTTDFNTLPTIANMHCSTTGQMAIKIAWRSKARAKEAGAMQAGQTRYINSGYILKVEE